MKIGIFTFHRSYNNGAILQAYALEQMLNELGADTEIVDFRNKDIEEPARLIKRKEKINLKTLFKILYRFYRHRKINCFIREKISLSRPVKTERELFALNDKYDYFITGSDQIWNDSHIKGNKCFFLDFVENNSKKYAYAASIGGDINKASETVKLYGKYIEKYQTISLRESNIKEYFSNLYGHKVRCDLDPVLLLNSDKWKSIASPRLHKKKYIFMYLVPNSPHIRAFANNMAKMYEYAVIDNKTSKEYFFNCGIDNFISWIYYAEIVITNSFHGTAFSILFNKDFFVELESEIGFNYRVHQLLDAVGLENVNIASDKPVKINSRKDYSVTNQKLNKLKDESISYLKSIFNNTKKG